MARRRDSRAILSRRDERARALGWSGYSQRRYWTNRLRNEHLVRDLAEQIGGPVEPERAGSLMSLQANDMINPRWMTRTPGEWRVRLLRAAGRI